MDDGAIVDCSIYVNVPDGFYFGTVRYRLENEKGGAAQTVFIKTFQELLIEGWTTLRFRDEALAAQAQEAKRKKKATRRSTGGKR